MAEGIKTIARLSAVRDLIVEGSMKRFSESYSKAQVVARALDNISDKCGIPEVRNMVVDLFNQSTTDQELIIGLLKEQDEYHRVMQKELKVIEKYCKLQIGKSIKVSRK